MSGCQTSASVLPMADFSAGESNLSFEVWPQHCSCACPGRGRTVRYKAGRAASQHEADLVDSCNCSSSMPSRRLDNLCTVPSYIASWMIKTKSCKPIDGLHRARKPMHSQLSIQRRPTQVTVRPCRMRSWSPGIGVGTFQAERTPIMLP